MADELGYVTLPVIPSFKGASQSLEAELNRSKIGATAGATTGKQFGTGFSKGVVTTGRRGTNELFETAGKSAVGAGLGIGRRAGAGITKGLKEYAKFAGASVAGFFAVQQVKSIVTDSIAGASDLAESANKIQVVFGSAADEVYRFGSTADTALGQSELEARNAAATFGVFGKSAGLAGHDLAEFSTDLDTLASDMASFSNTSPEQAIEAIGAALRGESEPIRTYGVLLDDATLRNKALALGLVDTTKNALTPQQKVLSAYQVILDQTGDAQGDFARTSDGLANQQRILAAQFTNLEATVGQKVLPILATGTKFLTGSLIPALGTTADIAGSIPGPIRNVAIALVAVKAAGSLGVFRGIASGFERVAFQAQLTGERIATANKRMFALKAGAGAAGFGLLALADQADQVDHGLGVLTETAGYAALGFSVGGPWGAAIGGGIGLLKGVVGGGDDAKASIDGLTASVDENTGAWTRNSRVEAGKIAVEVYPLLKAAGISTQDFTDALLGNEKAFGRVLVAADRIPGPLRDKVIGPIDDAKAAADRLANESFVRLTTQTHKVTAEQVFLGNATRTMGGRMFDTAGDVGTYADNVTKLEDPLADAARATHDLYEETVKLDNRALGIRGALSNYQAALDGVTSSLKENGHSLDITTEKGRANRDALDGVAQAALDAESHMGKVAKIKFNNDAHDKLVDLYLTFNDNEKAAKRYADRVLGTVIPVEVKHKGSLEDVTAAAKDVGEQKPNVKATADTSSALSTLQRFSRDANAALGGIQDEPVQINLSAVAAQTAKVISQLGGQTFRDGGAVGAIRGPGGPRDDLIPAMLSNGERVNRADIVTRLGHGNNAYGQQRFEALEAAILRGDFDRMGDPSAFRDGGPVVKAGLAASGLSSAVGAIDAYVKSYAAIVSAGLSEKASQALTYAPTGGQLGPGGVLTPAQIVRGQQAATAQVGKPYIWGGVGPSGYDCSGFQSFVLNSAMGYANPYFRRGSTGTMPWPGSAAGPGRYTIGWTPNWSGGIGHTSGNIGGLNVESYGGHGPAVGGGARSPYDPHFTGLMHYRDGGAVFKADTGGWLTPGWNHVYNGTGRPEEIPNPQPGGYADREVVKLLGTLVRRVESLEDTIRSEEGATRATIHPGMSKIADQRIDRRAAFNATRVRSRR